MNDKPREFWCIRHPGTNQRLACDTKSEADKYYEGYQPITHVIEKSAYNTLAAKLAEVEKEQDELTLKVLYSKDAEQCERWIQNAMKRTSERDAALERAEKFEQALNKIGMLSMSEAAYTREFTEKVEQITRAALSVPKKWPY